MNKKNYPYYFLEIFTKISVITIIFLVIYYLSPNNYILNDQTTNSNISKSLQIRVNPIDNFELTRQFGLIKKIKFDKNVTLIIYNLFKSQSVNLQAGVILENKFDSDISVLNNSNIPIDYKIDIIA